MEYRHYHILSFELAPTELSKARDWLYQKKCLGVETSFREKESTHIRAYFKGSARLNGIQNQIARNFPRIHKLEATTIGLPVPTDSPKHFEPFNLVDGIWVSCERHASSDGRREIVLKPGLAFGTGRHDTTQLMAQLMSLLNHRPSSLLDIGTGTGILAIYGKILGIDQVSAVEISSTARKNARENLKQNGWEDIRIESDLQKTRGQFDVVLANLVTSTILALKREILARMAPGGVLILSGITDSETEEVRQAYPELRLEKEIQQGDWMGMLLRLKSNGRRH